MSRVSSYRLVLPRPWVRIPVQTGTEERVREVVTEVAARAPKDVPPDQLGPWRRELERRLVADVRAARDYGGVDFYLPSDTWHGFLVGASFVVSEVSPPGQRPDELDEDGAVGQVLAELVRTSPETQPVTIADTTWVRAERVEAADPDRAADLDLATRRVEYLTAVPAEPRRWVLVAFSCTGDGDPRGDLATLTVELFDAIMGTWRWVREGDEFDVRAAETAETPGTQEMAAR